MYIYTYCMYVCICIYIYIYIYIYTICVYMLERETQTWKQLLFYKLVNTTHSNTYYNLRIVSIISMIITSSNNLTQYIYIYIYVYTHNNTHTYTYHSLYIYIYMYTYAYIHINLYKGRPHGSSRRGRRWCVAEATSFGG